MKTYQVMPGLKAIAFLTLLGLITAVACYSEDKGKSISDNLVFVEGGKFEMGDVFGDGRDNEQPVHEVTLNDFFISKYEVSVGQFMIFVEETGYKTSAGGPNDPEARKKIMERFASGDLSEQDRKELHEKFLKLSGAGYWDAEKRTWTGYGPLTNWKNPGIEQTDSEPVLAVSVDDAMHYCNWLSEKAGLPVAYDLKTGNILNKDGNPTRDITTVKGYRLPTEAEWEYAAREGGRKVRFGNGKNIARSSEINFRGDEGDYSYLERGDYLGGTKPVGSYPPSSIGLYDMSGNAWEWVSDNFSEYTQDSQVNPYIAAGNNHALRGGRWGGDADEARVFHRSAWPRNDRCNNSGFRIARSAN
jgi:formylglycine-generating enzyme required for sulfatase activity